MRWSYSLEDITHLDIRITAPCLIFLYGDVWAGKTTLSQQIIRRYLWKDILVSSPTYVYYNSYESALHFDLYRVSDYEYFVSLWGEEILDNNEGIILVEWPEILHSHYRPDIKIHLSKDPDRPEYRNIQIEYLK